MDKLIRSALILCLLYSCNVVQIATQGETKVPDEFFLTDQLPFNANPLTMTYNKTKSYLKKLESSVPSNFSFTNMNQEFALMPYSWGSDWSANSIQSNRTNSVVTPGKWIADQLRLIEEDKGSTGKYESITWKILNTLNTLCAVGLILGNELGLGEFDYPQDGTYGAVIDAKAAYAMGKYCDMSNPEQNIGMTIPVTVSTPANTTIYDKMVNLMGETIYLKYDNQTMNVTTVSSYSGGSLFSKLIINDDQVSNGLRLEFIDGPNNATANDDEEHTAVRFWYDSTAAGAALEQFMFMFHRFYDSSTTDTTKTFFVGGNANTMDRMSIMMMANELSTYSSTEDFSYGCFNKADWSINADGNFCGVGNEVDGSLQMPAYSQAQAYYNFSTNFNTNLTAHKTIGETTITGFSIPGDMQTASF